MTLTISILAAALMLVSAHCIFAVVRGMKTVRALAQMKHERNAYKAAMEEAQEKVRTVNIEVAAIRKDFQSVMTRINGGAPADQPWNQPEPGQ